MDPVLGALRVRRDFAARQGRPPDLRAQRRPDERDGRARAAVGHQVRDVRRVVVRAAGDCDGRLQRRPVDLGPRAARRADLLGCQGTQEHHQRYRRHRRARHRRRRPRACDWLARRLRARVGPASARRRGLSRARRGAADARLLDGRVRQLDRRRPLRRCRLRQRRRQALRPAHERDAVGDERAQRRDVRRVRPARHRDEQARCDDARVQVPRVRPAHAACRRGLRARRRKGTQVNRLARAPPPAEPRRLDDGRRQRRPEPLHVSLPQEALRNAQRQHARRRRRGGRAPQLARHLDAAHRLLRLEPRPRRPRCPRLPRPDAARLHLHQARQVLTSLTNPEGWIVRSRTLITISSEVVSSKRRGFPLPPRCCRPGDGIRECRQPAAVPPAGVGSHPLERY
mmetsp:Transcript_7096/g.29537  ORF Transcript_7096/g.29537 Transcript_7096/m.29537 type:complete len:399 (-) Transcript_7096:43-1239(-)